MRIRTKITEYIDNGVRHRMTTVDEVPSWYNHCFNAFFGAMMVLGSAFMIGGAIVLEFSQSCMAGEKPLSHTDEIVS